MSDLESIWYQKYWKEKETPEFNTWWLSDYGPPSQFDTDDEEEMDEYFLRKGFSLMGWIAREEAK